jgi:alpha-L-rhamnosidase
MNQIIQVRMNHGRLSKSDRYRVTEGCPTFSWGAFSDHINARQAAYQIQVHSAQQVLWQTAWIETVDQEAVYAGEALPKDERLYVRIAVRDDKGEVSEPIEISFFVSGLADHVPGWIAAQEDKAGEAVYFRRNFHLSGDVKNATLYVCGLGYHQLFLNGELLDSALLDPVCANYTKTCYYTMLPSIESSLVAGENCLCIALGEGWRRNEGDYLKYIGDRKIAFFGLPQLSASLHIQYTDGRSEVLDTDETWNSAHGAIVYNHLFNGETYDASKTIVGWNQSGLLPDVFQPVRTVAAPGGKACVMTLEPIVAQEVYAPRTITPLNEHTYLVDFGQNIAGVCRIRLPKSMVKGQTITIEHMEFLDEDGSLYLPNLRGALCRDIYIASGDAQDLDEWQPAFTYHGFRYVQITGLPILEKDDIQAISLYTDVASDSFFSCGSALINAIQKNIVQTEKSNIMGILTDCPQRDERMAWMNDATVRFEETPYNFDIGRLFPKVIQDLLDTQSADGAITCTAPYVYGECPADPVCSSFLVAGLQSMLHSGNIDVLRQAYDGFARWENYLSTRAVGNIITYSYYGDWAGPVYACEGGDHNLDAVTSTDTPGIFMSTGFYYYNAVLLSRFADILGKKQDVNRYTTLSEAIKSAMLDKWWNKKSGRMATGSQGCQSFSLWLGIIPEENRKLAAQWLHEDLIEKKYCITTGNLCTRYLMDALTENGYIDDAWQIITSEKYPSLGYMIQNEATTVWERFELKKNPGMNSYNHPMYGAVGYWFYAYIAGIKPTATGFSEVDIHPYFPKDLLSAHAQVITIKGAIIVRWVKRYGKTHLHVTVPFGVKAQVYFDGKQYTVGSGFWKYEAENK